MKLSCAVGRTDVMIKGKGEERKAEGRERREGKGREGKEGTSRLCRQLMTSSAGKELSASCAYRW